MASTPVRSGRNIHPRKNEHDNGKSLFFLKIHLQIVLFQVSFVSLFWGGTVFLSPYLREVKLDPLF